MKKLLISTLILGTASLNAQFYSEIKTGAVINQKADIAYKTGFQGALECGYKYNTWRAGFELLFNQYRPQKIEDDADNEFKDAIYNFDDRSFKACRFRNIAAMCNIYYDYTINEKWSTYIGCGLGALHMQYRFNGDLGADPKDYQFSKTFLAAQVLLGISYSINEHWQVSMGYRCLKAENGFMPRANKRGEIPQVMYKKPIKTPFMHTLECGLRYNF